MHVPLRVLVASLFCIGISSTLFAQGKSAGTNGNGNSNNTQLVITHAAVAGMDSPSPVLNIDGQNFGSSPTVFFGAPGGVFQQLLVVHSTASMIAASLNTVSPGTYYIVVQVGNSANDTAGLSITIGAVGPTGATGVTGDPGPAGPAGAPGATGPAGVQGPAGPTGAPGPVGPIGPQGSAGPTGSAGPAGPVGPAGPAGTTGAAGPAGPTGAAGPAGPVGPAGPAGATGAAGPAGPVGPAGPAGATGAAGPAGPIGPAGPTGATGAAGPAGPIGPAGPAGATGAAGPAGPVGPAGPAGATGAAGPAGAAGANGANGAAGPAGPAGASGALAVISDQTLLADTATISFGSIPSTYSNLDLVCYGRITAAVGDDYAWLQFNGDTGANYDQEFGFLSGTTSGGTGSVGTTGIKWGVFPGALSQRLLQAGIARVTIANYANTAFEKALLSDGGDASSASAPYNTPFRTMHSGFWRNTAAITSIVLYLPNGGNFKAGSRCVLYGY